VKAAGVFLTSGDIQALGELIWRENVKPFFIFANYSLKADKRNIFLEMPCKNEIDGNQ